MSDNIEVYDKFCSQRFSDIEDTQKDMGKDIAAIREKLFDGMSDALINLSDDVRDMKQAEERRQDREDNRKRSRALIMRDIILAVVGTGGILSLILDKIL